MACKFSCSIRHSEAFKENDVALFLSDQGDEYRVKYRSNVCRDLLVSIEWTIPKQVLVTVKLYSKTFKKCFSSKGSIVNGKKALMKLRGAFNVCSSPDYKILCLISIIPYVKFKKCNEKPIASDCSSEKNDSVIEIESQSLSVDENRSGRYDNAMITNTAMNVHELATPNNSEKNEFIMDEMPRFSTDNSNFTPDNKAVISDTEMKVFKIVTSNYGSAIADSVFNIEPQGMLNKHFSTSADRNSTIKNSNIYEAASSNVFVKAEKCLEIEMQAFIRDKPNFIPGIMDKGVTSNMELDVHKAVSPNDISARMGPLMEFESQGFSVEMQNFTVDDLDDAVINNVETNVPKVLASNNISAENNADMEIALRELSGDNHKNFTSHDVDNVVKSNAGMEVHKVLASNAISAKMNLDMEIALQELPKSPMDRSYIAKNRNGLASCDLDNAVISNEDKDVHMALTSNDDSPKTDPFMGIQLQRLSMDKCDFITEDLNEVEINDSKVLHSVESKDVFKGIFPVMESELKSLPLDKHDLVASSDTHDSVINNTAMEVRKSVSSILFSTKTNLVSETLTRRLSVDNCGLTSADIDDVIVSNGDIKTQKTKSSDACTKAFPIMESELHGLSMDMLDLLMSGDMADAVISNGNKEVKVHKAILSARSSVLKKLFTGLTEKNKENCVIVNVPNYLLEDVVVFMYVGLVNIKSMRMAEDLNQIAENYCINDLLDICSKYLSK